MFLEDVLFEMADVQARDFAESEVPLQDGDQIIGEIPRELRQLYTLAMRAANAHASAISKRTGMEIVFGSTRDGELERWQVRKEALQGMFFLSLYDHVCPNYDWPFPELCVRQGWLAVRNLQGR